VEPLEALVEALSVIPGEGGRLYGLVALRLYELLAPIARFAAALLSLSAQLAFYALTISITIITLYIGRAVSYNADLREAVARALASELPATSWTVAVALLTANAIFAVIFFLATIGGSLAGYLALSPPPLTGDAVALAHLAGSASLAAALLGLGGARGAVVCLAATALSGVMVAWSTYWSPEAARLVAAQALNAALAALGAGLAAWILAKGLDGVVLLYIRGVYVDAFRLRESLLRAATLSLVVASAPLASLSAVFAAPLILIAAFSVYMAASTFIVAQMLLVAGHIVAAPLRASRRTRAGRLRRATVGAGVQRPAPPPAPAPPRRSVRVEAPTCPAGSTRIGLPATLGQLYQALGVNPARVRRVYIYLHGRTEMPDPMNLNYLIPEEARSVRVVCRN
jgi:hypothetical protein